VLVEQHAEKERRSIPAEVFVAGGVMGDAELRRPGRVSHPDSTTAH
jgi:hypothetical protein